MSNIFYCEQFLAAMKNHTSMLDSEHGRWRRLFRGEDASKGLIEQWNAAGFDWIEIKDAIEQFTSISNEDLIELAINDDRHFHSVRELLKTRNSRELFNIVLSLCKHTSPDRRLLGMDILLGEASTSFETETIKLIKKRISKETDPKVIITMCYLFRDLSVENRSHYLRPHAFDADEDVRFAVTVCLSRDKRSIDTLKLLAADRNDDVRDWALFGLGCILEDLVFDSETKWHKLPQDVRAVLVQHLNDSFEPARREAIAALSFYKDPHVIPCILSGLKVQIAESSIDYLMVDAAGRVGDPWFLPYLLEIKSRQLGHEQSIDEAIQKCSV